jgi:plastocyanin
VRRAFLGLVLAVATVALTGCASNGGTGPGASPVATNKVDLPKSYLFSPAAITVKAGTAVTFTNDDNFTHTVQLLDPKPDTPRRLDLGQSVTITFDTPGLVHYPCSLHPQNMQGTVLVTS